MEPSSNMNTVGISVNAGASVQKSVKTIRQLHSLGEVCRITLKTSEEELEGIFGGMDYDTGSLVLFYPVSIVRSPDKDERKTPLRQTRKMIKKGEFSQLLFPNVVLSHTQKPNAEPAHDGSQLQKFFVEKATPNHIELEINKELDEEWDQFAENEKRFNVKATFDEEEYTTRLDINALTVRQKAKAEEISKEIERLPSSNFHLQEDRGQTYKAEQDVDEEKNYSAVIGTGHYQDKTTDLSNISIPPIEKIEEELEKPQRRVPLQGKSNKHLKIHHRNSLDCLGIDSACVMDPETHREMLKYKHQKMTMQTIQHMKSLSPKKRNVEKKAISGITQFDEKNSEDSFSLPFSVLESPKSKPIAFTEPVAELSVKAPTLTQQIPINKFPLELKTVHAKYKTIRQFYKSQYKKSPGFLKAKGFTQKWTIGPEISIYGQSYFYPPHMPLPVGNYYMDTYYQQYPQYMGGYYSGYQYYGAGQPAMMQPSFGYGYNPQ